MSVKETNLKSLCLLHRGKVRDVYEIDKEKILIVTTDRVSAYDSVLETAIPDKGVILNKLSIFWMNQLSSNIRNHLSDEKVEDYVSSDEILFLRGRSIIAKKLEPFGIEAVVRGFLEGSAWEQYKSNGVVNGIPLPTGMKRGDKLEEPLFTPTTKASVGAHDVNISEVELEKLLGLRISKIIKNKSIELFIRATSLLEKIGFDLVDTKFEFAMKDEELYLIDEVLTPDSSRLRRRKSLLEPAKTENFDKQIIRDALTAVGKDGAGNFPQQISRQTMRTVSKRYREVLKLVTKEETPTVGIVMGSESDWETMKFSVEILKKFGISFEVSVISAHRTPDRLFTYAEDADLRGLDILIAGAGGSAHLPGMLASKTVLPVFGVPICSRYMNGEDSLYSIVQMPKGVPVATFAIGEAGATNAALEAVSMLARGNERLENSLWQFRKDEQARVLSMHERVRKN